jgi:hypothetical protein
LYVSPNIIRVIKSMRIRRAGHVARMGEMRNVYRIFVRKHERKRPLGRLRCRWEDNIIMDRKKLRYEGVDWIQWRAVVITVMNLRVL